VKGRTDILTLHAKNVTMSDQVDLSTIARGTPGFSGAELASLINKAACKASKDGKVHVSMPDLEYAKDLILMGAERSAASFTLDNRRLTAFHEGGHALVATLTDGALPVHKATIMPRGHALGMVMQLPDQDMSSWSRRQMIAEMDVCMAGRAAEELIFGVGNITSGASSDLERATAIATSMVEKYGMSSKVGLVALSRGGKQRGGGGGQISEETLAVIDSEVRKLTDESYARALKMLKRHRRSLTALAEALLEAETLTGAQVREVVEESKAGRYVNPRLLVCACKIEIY
jgi:ATP-dependent metalloprotease